MMDWYSLVMWAAHFSGYQIPSPPPQIQYRSKEWFMEVPCKGHQCSLAGWYRDDDVIYIGDWLDDTSHDVFLIHEATHWLQHHSGKWRSGHCKDNFYREIEAYRVMNEYAQKVQHRITFFAVPPTQCTVERWDAP